MTTDFQTIAALVIVAITATWLVARAISKRRSPVAAAIARVRRRN